MARWGKPEAKAAAETVRGWKEAGEQPPPATSSSEAPPGARVFNPGVRRQSLLQVSASPEGPCGAETVAALASSRLRPEPVSQYLKPLETLGFVGSLEDGVHGPAAVLGSSPSLSTAPHPHELVGFK